MRRSRVSPWWHVKKRGFSSSDSEAQDEMNVFGLTHEKSPLLNSMSVSPRDRATSRRNKQMRLFIVDWF